MYYVLFDVNSFSIHWNGTKKDHEKRESGQYFSLSISLYSQLSVSLSKFENFVKCFLFSSNSFHRERERDLSLSFSLSATSWHAWISVRTFYERFESSSSSSSSHFFHLSNVNTQVFFRWSSFSNFFGVRFSVGMNVYVSFHLSFFWIFFERVCLCVLYTNGRWWFFRISKDIAFFPCSPYSTFYIGTGLLAVHTNTSAHNEKA